MLKHDPSCPLPYDVVHYYGETVPEYKTVMERGGIIGGPVTCPTWSGRYDPPAVGSFVSTTCNFFFGCLDKGEVAGYTYNDGFLYLVVKVLFYTDNDLRFATQQQKKRFQDNRFVEMAGAEISNVWSEHEPI